MAIMNDNFVLHYQKPQNERLLSYFSNLFLYMFEQSLDKLCNACKVTVLHNITCKSTDIHALKPTFEEKKSKDEVKKL